MPWSWVVGQERVVETLRRSVAAERVAQAYLFHGPDGVGKRVAALALAQALECERRQPGDDDACGECKPCEKVARMLHPDVHFFLALPSSHQNKPTGKEIEDVTARLQALAVDPYTEVSFRRRPDLSDPEKTTNLQAFYSVDRVRDEINGVLRYTPAEGRYKVAILTDADTMRTEAANSFLKSLEEPSQRTVLILTATRVDRLLPTIISRCQRVRFDALPAEEIEQALIERSVVGSDGAALISRMADGSFTQALDLAQNEGLAERRELIVRFFRAAYQGRALDIDPIISKLTPLSREQLRDTLVMMLGWVRDLILAREMGEEAPLVNVDQRTAISDFANNLPDAQLSAMASLIQHAMELISANTNTSLVLVNLADSLHHAIRGVEMETLY